ncbi:MAG: transposase [Chroococcidiopsidaceae cyanobacterium CP_BM_RX_35]|nr:transposase [Chroococcidiopsidaceae cyanobacterium CP_BM_RX_35]
MTIARTGIGARCPRPNTLINWRALPHDFPKWQTVYGYFRAWVVTGVWEKINAILIEKVRHTQGR